jgi:signal transduction histidine kinase
MSDELPRATQPAPEWVTRLLFAFVLLSLAALIVIPWRADRRVQPERRDANRMSDEARRLVTLIHLHMAQEGSAVDDYVDNRDSGTMHRFVLADSAKRSAYVQLSPLVAKLDTATQSRMARLMDLEQRWHRAVETELFAPNAPAAQRHGPIQEAIYDSMLVAAAELDGAIAQSARHRRDLIAAQEQQQQRTSVRLGLLGLLAAAVTWWLSRRTHAYAHAAEERRAALADAVAARARFMRGVSHDLKNPIHAIDGHAQLLEDGLRGPLTPEQQDSIARIRRSARSLMALIEDLLELARAESGQLAVKFDRVVLRDVVHEAVEEHRAAAEAAGLTLVHPDDKSQTILVTDAARVGQVLGNLLSNAIKYTPAGGRIEVMTDMPARRDPGDGARLAIHVADNGPGIPMDKYEEVFGEFTRLSNGDKPGAGLGLSIARRVARLLGGDITVSGGQGGGARFTLWLPLKPTG